MSNLSKASLLSATPEIKAQVQVTLTREQYQRLEDLFPARLTNDPTATAIYLGQQMVLQKLRQGFVAS